MIKVRKNLFVIFNLIILILFTNYSLIFASSKVNTSIPSDTNPMVTKIYPEDNEDNVTLDTKIMATFNKKMKEEDINEFSVTVNDGTSDIATNVKYNAELCKVIVTPLENLKPNHIYYVTINRMVRDLKGNTMLADKVWKFKTVSKKDSSPPMVIDVSPTVSASNVPLDTKIEILFNKKMYEPSINENTIAIKYGKNKVVGAIRYYSDINKVIFSPITPLKPDTLFEVNISSEICDASLNKLSTPYVYTFKTTKLPTLSSNISSLSNENVDTNLKVNDRLQTKTKNPKSLGNMKSNQLTNVKLEDDDELKNINIEIIEMFPAPNSEMIPLDEKIKVKFNKKMNPGTFNIFNFALQDGNEYIYGKIEYDSKNNIATFKPSGNLKPNRKYKVTISQNIEDIFGNKMPRDYSWEFKTITQIATLKIKDLKANNEPIKDSIAPYVIFTTPRDNEEFVSPNTQITATFNEPIRDFSVNSFTFRVLDGENEVKGQIYYDSSQKKAIFTPKSPLEDGRAYTAHITTGIMDLAGNYMAKDKKWKFIVGKNFSNRSPKIVQLSPDRAETDVDVTTVITATFDKKMKISTINPYTFFVKEGNISVQGRVIYDQNENKAIFAPWSALKPNTLYTVTLSKTIEDIEGMQLSETFVWQFKTGNGLSSKVSSNINTTSVSASNEANMQIELQKNMNPNLFSNNTLTDIDIMDNQPNNKTQNLSIQNIEKTNTALPYNEIKDRASISDKSALGKIQTKRINDTLDQSELVSDDSPDEFKKRVTSSDKGAYGQLKPKRIKDTVSADDIVDIASAETLKDQIAKFLSSDVKTNARLADQIDLLPDNNISNNSKPLDDNTNILNESINVLENDFIESPNKNILNHIPNLDKNEEISNSSNFIITSNNSQNLNNIKEKYNEKNEVFTKPSGIDLGLEMKNSKSTFVQMSDPPSSDISVNSPKIKKDALKKSPIILNSKNDDDALKLEKIEKYEGFEDLSNDDKQISENENKNNNVESNFENGKTLNLKAKVLENSNINNIDLASNLNKNKDSKKPQGVINGIPIDQLLNESDNSLNFENINAKNENSDENKVSLEGSKKDSKLNMKNSFASLLSDVGTIPSDKNSFFVVAIYPNKNMTNVDLNATITAAFNQELDASSINGSSFIVSGNEKQVAGKILYNQRLKKIIFRPNQPLESKTEYLVQLTNAIKSVNGQPLLPLSWRFTTK